MLPYKIQDPIHPDLMPALERTKKEMDPWHWEKLISSDGQWVAYDDLHTGTNTVVVLSNPQQLPFVPGIVRIEIELKGDTGPRSPTDVRILDRIQFISGPRSVPLAPVHQSFDQLRESVAHPDSDMTPVGRTFKGADFMTAPPCKECGHAKAEDNIVLVQSFDRFVFASAGVAPIPYGRTLHALIQVGGIDRGIGAAISAVNIKLRIAKQGTSAYNSLAKEYGFA